jgi:hypothetical protein
MQAPGAAAVSPGHTADSPGAAYESPGRYSVILSEAKDLNLRDPRSFAVFAAQDDENPPG